MITVQSSTIVLLRSTVDYHRIKVYNVAPIIVCKLNKVRYCTCSIPMIDYFVLSSFSNDSSSYCSYRTFGI